MIGDRAVWRASGWPPRDPRAQRVEARRVALGAVAGDDLLGELLAAPVVREARQHDLVEQAGRESFAVGPGDHRLLRPDLREERVVPGAGVGTERAVRLRGTPREPPVLKVLPGAHHAERGVANGSLLRHRAVEHHRGRLPCAS
jgi:hypothetical protein